MCQLSGTKFSLVALLVVYTISNLISLVSSIVAWKKVTVKAEQPDCVVAGILCSTSVWGVFVFQEIASFINLCTTSHMLLFCLLRGKGSQLDPLYVFRGVFFTLIIMALVVLIGWSEASHISYDNEGVLSQFVGIKGGFILQTLLDIPGTTPAVVLAHFNLFFGAIICGLAAALAPPAGIMVGVHGVEPVARGTA